MNNDNRTIIAMYHNESYVNVVSKNILLSCTHPSSYDVR